MANFSELDENDVVIRVIMVADKYEGWGEKWCTDMFGGRWIQTSYNTESGVHKQGKNPVRKNFGRVGYKYDRERDAFIPPSPFQSWRLNDSTCQWEAPIPYPLDAKKLLKWDDENQGWVPMGTPVIPPFLTKTF